MKFVDRRMEMVFLSLLLIAALILVNEQLYNGVMMPFVPIAFILSVTVFMWNRKSLSVLRAILFVGLLVFAMYATLPEYTLSQAVEKIRTEFEGISSVTAVSNTPVTGDPFNPFKSDWYYTFEIVEDEGTSYLLLHDPHSDYFVVKQ